MPLLTLYLGPAVSIQLIKVNKANDFWVNDSHELCYWIYHRLIIPWKCAEGELFGILFFFYL